MTEPGNLLTEVVGADGAATVAKALHAGDGRCLGLHYGTYD